MKEHKYDYSLQVTRNTSENSLIKKNELKFCSDVMKPCNRNILRVEECTRVIFADFLRHGLPRRATRVS
jgi:hypothetical protein